MASESGKDETKSAIGRPSPSLRKEELLNWISRLESSKSQNEYQIFLAEKKLETLKFQSMNYMGALDLAHELKKVYEVPSDKK